MLTLRRAFHSVEAVLKTDLIPPRQLNPEIDRDLEAVVLKSLRKDPDERYSTSLALADDLKRWLHHEPTTAPGASGEAPGALVPAESRLGGRDRDHLSGDRWHSCRGSRLLPHAGQGQGTPAPAPGHPGSAHGHHRDGWSRRIWHQVGQAATIERDRRIQSEAAACLAGLDVRSIKTFDFQATSLAFDPARERLFIGSSDFFQGKFEDPVRIWDSKNDQLQTTVTKGSGVFAFRADGAALLLKSSTDERSKLELWDVERGQIVGTFASPLEGKSAIAGFTMTPTGTVLAASVGSLDAKGGKIDDGVVVAWDATTGRVLFRRADQGATYVALTPDATLLASGHENGRIAVWSLPEGNPIATLKAGRNTINCLAFGRDALRRKQPKTQESGWLLATGDAGGVVLIWDLQYRIPRVYCRGSAHHVRGSRTGV